MREYGRVYSAIWQSPKIRSLSEDGRTLMLYLLTSPHANLVGCYRLPEAYASDDLQWPSERVSKGFDELSSKGILTVDKATKWVFIHSYLEWNPFENANVAKAARKVFDQIPSSRLKSLLAQAILTFASHLDEDFRKGLETLREPFENPEPEPIQNQIREPEPKPARAARERTTLSASDLEAEGADPIHARDWLKARKRPLTQTAWGAIKDEAGKAALTVREVVRICAVKGWESFDHTWSWPGKTRATPAQSSSNTTEEAARLLGFDIDEVIDAQG